MATAIICGTDLRQYGSLYFDDEIEVASEYGTISSPLFKSTRSKSPLYFLSRHGVDNSVAPHLINYRANIDILKQQGIEQIIAVNTVGGLIESMGPGVWVCPDQIIDYSYGREQTFFDGIHHPMKHVDFSFPFSDSLREQLLKSAEEKEFTLIGYGTYAVTQGPRLETAAEIKRLQNDGAHIVGMTMMPEAILAKEVGIGYSSICLVANWGAGMEQKPLDIEEIYKLVKAGFVDVVDFLSDFFEIKK